jgi:hypothetical protein
MLEVGVLYIGFLRYSFYIQVRVRLQLNWGDEVDYFVGQKAEVLHFSYLISMVYHLTIPPGRAVRAGVTCDEIDRVSGYKQEAAMRLVRPL